MRKALQGERPPLTVYNASRGITWRKNTIKLFRKVNDPRSIQVMQRVTDVSLSLKLLMELNRNDIIISIKQRELFITN